MKEKGRLFVYLNVPKPLDKTNLICWSTGKTAQKIKSVGWLKKNFVFQFLGLNFGVLSD